VTSAEGPIPAQAVAKAGAPAEAAGVVLAEAAVAVVVAAAAAKDVAAEGGGRDPAAPDDGNARRWERFRRRSARRELPRWIGPGSDRDRRHTTRRTLVEQTMRSYLDCIPCLVRHALQAARFATDDESIHRRVLHEVLREAATLDDSQPPPVMSHRVHRMIRELSGHNDPYRDVKDRFNRFALEQLPRYRQLVADSAAPLETAVRLAIAGNVIDFGPYSDVDEDRVEQTVAKALRAPIPRDEIVSLAAAVQQADEILYLADNAGEIVFDRLLIEQLPEDRVTVVVKGGPAVNDATMDDAVSIGLDDLVSVIGNGSDAPGTLLDDCSPAFRGRFEQAELIIAKGQANYETLSEADGSVFFLLMAKCPVVARDLGVEVGQFVVRQRRQVEEQAA
jgi:hypothetical protein